ncbi:MAG: hypothetical protein ACPLRS_03150 [Hydrogenobacter sp.]
MVDLREYLMNFLTLGAWNRLKEENQRLKKDLKEVRRNFWDTEDERRRLQTEVEDLRKLLELEREEKEKLRAEIEALKQEREEGKKEMLEEILRIVNGYGKLEDGKLYLTAEGLRKLMEEWKVSRKGLKQYMEAVGLRIAGRTMKAIAGAYKHAYIFILDKTGYN